MIPVDPAKCPDEYPESRNETEEYFYQEDEKDNCQPFSTDIVRPEEVRIAGPGRIRECVKPPVRDCDEDDSDPEQVENEDQRNDEQDGRSGLPDRKTFF